MINDAASSRHVVNIRIRTYRRPEIGDKFAPRFAQKATAAIILGDEDMPLIEGDPRYVPGAGKPPDMIMNPLALVGRMTIGLIIEMLTGMVATTSMQRADASAFREYNFDEVKAELLRLGYASSGKRSMIDGRSGRRIMGQIFVGPAYVQALRHHIRDKIQARGTGHVRAVDRQPPGGKSQHGGTRNGEMEFWAMLSHGATSFIQDRSCTSSDAVTRVMCRRCKIEAIQTDVGEFLPCQKCKGGTETLLRVTTPYAQMRITYMMAAAGFIWRPNFISVEQYEQALKNIKQIVESSGSAGSTFEIEAGDDEAGDDEADEDDGETIIADVDADYADYADYGEDGGGDD